jgi:methylmalonyl-CoA decarboxylase
LRQLGNSHPLSPETFKRIQGLRRKAYDSADYLEGKQAVLEKSKLVFRGE